MVAIRAWNGSSGSVSRERVSRYFSRVLTGRPGSGFGSWKTVPAVPVPLSVPGKTVLTVPVYGSNFPVPVRLLGHPDLLSYKHQKEERRTTKELKNRISCSQRD